MANNGMNKNGASKNGKAVITRPSGVKMRVPTPAKKTPQPAIPYPVTPR